MHPHQIPIDHGRVYTAGERYLQRVKDGVVVPRAVSSHEVPAGFKAMIADEDGDLILDNTPTELAIDVRDASAMTGAAISHDVGHADAPRASVPVSNPNSMADPMNRERIVATKKIAEQYPEPEAPTAATEKPLPKKARRGRGAPDLTGLGG